MKNYILGLACLLLTGCVTEQADHREVVAKLDAIKAELATKHSEPVKWAFASKNDITMAINKWKTDKLAEFKKTEALSPEDEKRLQEYEALQAKLMRMRMGVNRTRFHQPASMYDNAIPSTEEEVQEFMKKVDAAKVPVEAILDRRDKEAVKYNNEFTPEDLIAEYAKDRYELVIDNSFSGRDNVLFRSSGEVPDITQGVIMLFKAKTKP